MSVAALRSYAPYVMRDLFARALVPLAVFATFAGIPIAAMMGGLGNDADPDPAALGAVMRMAYISVAPLAMTLGSFLLMTQSVAADRERQYVRFTFSHPIAPAQYYLAYFLAAVTIFLVCFLPLPLIARGFGAEVPIVGSLVAMLATLLLIGGLTTLCAALTQKDGLLLILAYVGTQTMQQLAAADILPSWIRPLARGLPPIETLGQVVKSLLEGTDWPVTDMIHVFGYGIGLLVAGLLVIRRAPLVR